MQSPPTTCFLGTATPGRAASKKRSARSASGTTAAAKPRRIAHDAACSARAVGSGQTEGMTRGVVLGGGGIAGVAWEAGIVIGLRRAGVDLSSADVIVGTSAGSIVGSHV